MFSSLSLIRILRLAPRACLLTAVAVISTHAVGQTSPDSHEATHGSDAPPDYDRLFAMDRVHVLQIKIEPEDYAMMREDLETIGPQGMPAPAAAGPFPPRGGFRGAFGGAAPNLTGRDPIYVPVTVMHDGRSWSGVGMRYKGNSSLMSARMSGNGKVPFRLDFDRYEDEVPGTRNQRFYGFEKLTFSSNYSDASMLKEVLATEIFRDRGVPAARAAFYRIFVDTGNGDEYWGLYTMIEDPADGAMLDAQFGSGGGNLYKPDGRGANWVVFDEQGFGKKTNEKAADYSDVAAAIAALHAAQDDPAAWRRELESRFDVDGFLRWLAVNTVIQNWDSYGRMAHNYYLYGDPAEAGRLRWIPWDHNMAFGMAGGIVRGGPRGAAFGSQIVAPPPGLRGLVQNGRGPFTMGGDDILHTNSGEAWPLISRVLNDEVYAARYREWLEEALGGLAAPEAFAARARELHALIAPFVVGEQGERPSHTTLSSPQSFENALDGPGGLIEFVNSRHDQVRAALEQDDSR